MARVSVDTRKCTGCHQCEIACSAWHEGQFRPSLARLRVEADPASGKVRAFACTQDRCGKCRDACPEGAIKTRSVPVKVSSGTIQCTVLVVEPDECTGCGVCVDVCPLKVIFLHPDTGKAVKCDLCDGEPQCVLACQNPLVQAVELRPDQPARVG